MSYGTYQPAHEPHLTKHHSQVYEFDSPATIAKHSQQQQFMQAGGPAVSSAPAAPSLPQLAFKNARPLSLKTRDWGNKPWNGMGNAYHPPTALLQKSSIPTTSSAIPGSGIQPSMQQAMQSGLQTGHSGLPSTSYAPTSTIPLSHNYHLPSSNLSLSSTNDSSLPTSNLSKSYSPSSSFSSGIPPAPAWSGFKFGAWRANRSRSAPLRLRTKSWGTRSKQGWSGFNSRSILDEGFLRNRPTFAPSAPPMRSRFAPRQWRSGPYRMRPLRTRNWGSRNEEGWSFLNRGLYAHESALPFVANRNKWWESDFLSARSASRSAPLQQTQQFQPQVQQVQQLQQFAPAPILAAPIAAAPIAAAPLKGRKAKRAARKLAKQQAIGTRLTTELAPPVGDPALNHYRRGAKATVPLAGPAVSLAPPTGSKRSRRAGRRNTKGPRRNRLAGPALPVPATQPPVVAPIAAPIMTAPIMTAPIMTAPILSSSAPIFNSSAPLTSATSFSSVPLVASAGIPLNTGSSGLYSSSAQQARPLSSTFGQNVMGSNQPLYSANEPVAAQLMEKKFAQQPIISNRPIGSATF